MYDRFLKLKKPLLIVVVVVLLLALFKSLSVEPLSHVIAPSTIRLGQVEWEGRMQLGDDCWDYTCTLPNQISEDEVLCMMSSWVNMDVYVDDQQVYHFDDSDMLKGTAVHWIKLPLWTAGKTLHVVYTGTHDQIVRAAGRSAYYGRAALVYLKYITERAYAFVYAIGATLLMLLVAYFYRLLKRQLDASMKRSLWYLELFLLTSMIWVVCDSKIIFIVSRGIGATTMFSFIALLLFPLFLILFISELVGGRIRVIEVLSVVYGIAFVVVGGGYLTGLLPLKQSLVWIHILILVSAFASIWGVCGDMRRHPAKETKKILMGFCGIAFFGVLEILCYRFFPTVTYSVYVCIGLFLFAVLLIWAAYDRLYYLMGRQAKMSAYRRLAYKDVMTDLGNRAAFMKAQDELVSVTDVGVVVMDINDLKYTNDRYGHQAGDEMICCAAACVAAAFGSKGKSHRVGGDEFVAIIPHATEAVLAQLLDELEAQIGKAMAQMEKPWTLHIACGYAVGVEEQSAEQLLKQADDRMYENKHQMKNDRAYRETHRSEEVLEKCENEKK